MPTTIDPTWGVPVYFMVLAAIGVAWAKLTARAHQRRRGTGPAKPGTSHTPQVR